MNYYLLAMVLITIILSIVIINLICKIHELYVKIKLLNEHVNEVLNIVKDHAIITKEVIKDIDDHLVYQNHHLNVVENYIRNELKDELNAIGRTTTEQADIMLKIEEKINELEIKLERTDEKEGDVIESERIPAACVEN